jgi:ParB-like chromosome segregation protein Spo0J
VWYLPGYIDNSDKELESIMEKKARPLVGKIEITYVDIGEIKRTGYNPRRILPEAYEKLKKSLGHFGLVDPLIIRKQDKTVIGGEQRLTVLEETGVKRIPVVAIDIAENEAKALNIQLNNPNSQGFFDDEALGRLLNELVNIEDIEITGFSIDEIDKLCNIQDPIIDIPTGTYKEQYGVIVICASETEQQEVYEKLEAQGFNCKVVAT